MNYTNAIPVQCDTPIKGMMGGAAALVRHDGDVYLATSAHTPLGTHPTPRWEDWATSITLHLSTTSIELPLFRASAFGARVPLFGYAQPSHGPLLHDTMWLPLESTTLAAIEAEYPIFEVRENFGIDSALTAYGYPTAGGGFPSSPTPQCTGQALRFEGNVLETTLPIVPGYSGGPVLDQEQELVGIAIGQAGAIGQISPSNAIWRMMTDWKSKLTPE